jgi:hypothetical protein
LRDVVSANEAWPLEDDQTYRHTPSDMFTKTSTMAGLLARGGACLTDDRLLRPRYGGHQSVRLPPITAFPVSQWHRGDRLRRLQLRGQPRHWP